MEAFDILHKVYIMKPSAGREGYPGMFAGSSQGWVVRERRWALASRLGLQEAIVLQEDIDGCCQLLV